MPFCCTLYPGTESKSQVALELPGNPVPCGGLLFWWSWPDDYYHLPHFVGDFGRICHWGRKPLHGRQEHLDAVRSVFPTALGGPSSASSDQAPLQACSEPPTHSCFIPLSVAVCLYPLCKAACSSNKPLKKTVSPQDRAVLHPLNHISTWVVLTSLVYHYFVCLANIKLSLVLSDPIKF